MLACVCVCACVRTGRHETYLIHVESVRTKGPPRQVRGYPLYSNDKRTGEKQTRGQDNKSRKRDNSNSTHITRGTNQWKRTREEENEEQIIRGI